MIGPWVHKYPHFARRSRGPISTARPSPRVNKWSRHQYLVRTSCRRCAPISVMARNLAAPRIRPRIWIVKDEWQQPDMQSYYVDQFGGLDEGVPIAGATGQDVYIKSPLDTGTASGEWFTLKPDAEMAGDQRVDDAGSLVFETVPLAKPTSRPPVLTLDVACDEDWANLIARIIDIHPDGTATRVTFGVLNLAHRVGNAEPKALEKGKKNTDLPRARCARLQFP